MSEFSLPETIQIAGHTIKVIRSTKLCQKEGKENGEHVYGFFSPEKLTICLREDLKGSMLIDTFWHEVVEAINDTFDLDLPHSAIQTLGASLQQVSTFIPGLKE